MIFQVVINTEWGAFGNRKNGVSALDFLATEYDRNVDNMSINPHQQMLVLKCKSYIEL